MQERKPTPCLRCTSSRCPDWANFVPEDRSAFMRILRGAEDLVEKPISQSPMSERLETQGKIEIVPMLTVSLRSDSFSASYPTSTGRKEKSEFSKYSHRKCEYRFNGWRSPQVHLSMLPGSSHKTLGKGNHSRGESRRVGVPPCPPLQNAIKQASPSSAERLGEK